MPERPRLILYPRDLNNLEKLARLARFVAQPDYQWTQDGIAFVRTETEHGEVVCSAAARRNKTSITIWEH